MKPTLILTPKTKPTLQMTPKTPVVNPSNPQIRQIDMRTIALKNALQNKINPLQSNLV